MVRNRGQTCCKAERLVSGSRTCSGKAVPKPRKVLTALYDHSCGRSPPGLFSAPNTPRVGGWGGGVECLPDSADGEHGGQGRGASQNPASAAQSRGLTE